MSSQTKLKTQNVAIGAALTALVMVLQFLGAFIHFGPFSVSLVLVPIVIGAALCGTGVGAWLGFMFGVVVLLSGDAAAFMSINMPGTIITVLLKGIACGLAAGVVYNLLARFNRYLAVICAAIVCPVVNTGIFLLGCWVFFLDGVSAWGVEAGQPNVVAYMFLTLTGGNFIFELITNLILGPAVVTVLKVFKR